MWRWNLQLTRTLGRSRQMCGRIADNYMRLIARFMSANPCGLVSDSPSHFFFHYQAVIEAFRANPYYFMFSQIIIYDNKR